MSDDLARAREANSLMVIVMNDLKAIIIEVGPFAQAGVFKPAARGSLHDQSWQVELPGLVGSAYFDHFADQLFLSFPGDDEEWEIPLESVVLEFGIRWFFKCHCCDRRRSKLVLSDEGLLCTEWFSRYLGRPGVEALRTAELALRDQREEHRPRHRSVFRRGLRVDDDHFDGRKILRALRPTDVAFGKGNIAFRDETLTRYLAKKPTFWCTALSAPAKEVPPQSVELIAGFAGLDLRRLPALGLMIKGEVHTGTFLWDTGEDPFLSLALVVDWRKPDPIIISRGDAIKQHGIEWQRLHLSPQKDGRFRFVCPVRNTNCDVLYFRNGYFSSREAQRLVHKSQRAQSGSRPRKAGSKR